MYKEGGDEMETVLMYIWKGILWICLLNGCFAFFAGNGGPGTVGFSLNLFMTGIIPYTLYQYLTGQGIVNVYVASVIAFITLMVVSYVGVSLTVLVLKRIEKRQN